MQRLIDANKIVYSWVIDNDGEEHDGITLQSIIDKMPTVDAVEVVRCKDCKYLNIINKAPVYACCSKHNHTFYLWEEDTREYFCSWGERKEDNYEEPDINPCRGCEDYDGKGGCLSNGGCGEGR